MMDYKFHTVPHILNPWLYKWKYNYTNVGRLSLHRTL